MHRDQAPLTSKNCPTQICWWILMCEFNRWCLFFCFFSLKEGFIWNMESYINQKQEFNLVKYLSLDWFVYYKNRFSLQKLVIDGQVYLCIVMFLAAVLNSHCDGTHSRQRIHLWASDVMQNFFNVGIILKILF